MKVFVLGASGTFGGGTARLLAADERVSEVVLAARNAAPLQSLADELGEKARVVAVDATDRAAVARAVAGYDVLVNATGFYESLLEPVLDAAIEAGVGYVDISESCEALDLARARHDAARAAGVTAVHGLGSTPGINSLLAVHAASRLDRCRHLQLGFVVSAAAYFPPPGDALDAILARERPLAVHATVAETMGERVRVREAGAPSEVDSMSARRQIRLPGDGEPWVYPIAMAPPITLGERFPEVESIACCMAFLPDAVNAIVYRHGSAHGRGEVSLAATVRALFDEVGNLPDADRTVPEGLPAYRQWAVAAGERDGRPVTVGVALGDPLPTAPAFAAGALALGSGELNRPGVWPPERCFEPLPLFDAASRLQYGRPYDPNALMTTED